MTDTIRKIVSEYTKISVSDLQPDTAIGRTALGNSIVLHRMYAAIAKEGIEVPGYQEIKTFSELADKISGTSHDVTFEDAAKKITVQAKHSTDSSGIGIDIEEISQMPVVNDFREDSFYQMNFTPEEIAYCILQPDQYASFAGLFAAKEAIVKADNTYQNKDFNSIFVDHLPGGKPVFAGFTISISHTPNVSVAVATKNAAPVYMQPHKKVPKKKDLPLIVAVIAIIIALIAILISIFK